MCVFWEFLEFYSLSWEMILLSWSFGCYSDNNNELPRFLKKTIVVKKGSYLQFKSVCEYYTDKRFLSHDIKQKWNSTNMGTSD